MRRILIMFSMFKRRASVCRPRPAAGRAARSGSPGPYFAFGRFRSARVGRSTGLSADRRRLFWRGAPGCCQALRAGSRQRPARRRRRQAVATGRTGPSADAVQLRERFEEAVATLKQKRRSGHSLYDLPWYVIIGAPGSGKTTALVNSGLQFPAGAASREGRAARRRRHAQLRLVVHRRGGAARHRRPLHDAGLRRRRRQRRLGGVPGAAAASTASAGPINGVHARRSAPRT